MAYNENGYVTNQGGAARAPQTLREKVTFEINVPVAVKLEFDPPTQPKAGRFGDQFMYWCEGHKVFWADPPLHAAILATHAQAGTELELCKREVREGNRKRIAWEAVNQARQVSPPAQAAPAPPARELAQAFGEPLKAAPRKPASRETLELSERITGNLMAAALRQAIEACATGEEVAAGLGLDFHFRAEDARAMASTIYIAHTGGSKK